MKEQAGELDTRNETFDHSDFLRQMGSLRGGRFDGVIWWQMHAPWKDRKWCTDFYTVYCNILHVAIRADTSIDAYTWLHLLRNGLQTVSSENS